MSRDVILQKLREEGYRITNQRRLIIDTILANDCSCCKEIYYQVHKKDPDMGVATVYRMIKTLEEIGVLDRKIVLRDVRCKEVVLIGRRYGGSGDCGLPGGGGEVSLEKTQKRGDGLRLRMQWLQLHM